MSITANSPLTTATSSAPSPSEATPSTPSTNSIMRMSQVQLEDETATVMAPVAAPPNDPPPAASVAVANAAATKKRKQAADICKQADKEHASKLGNCLQFEQQMHKLGTSVSQLTTPLPAKNPSYDIEWPIAPVGTVVNSGPDLSPGMCQHGYRSICLPTHGGIRIKHRWVFSWGQTR
eukprot:scaffold661734_cov71-Attheya_sp.AAC.1